MKKLGLMILLTGIVLLAGCAGDNPANPGGTLADVTGLTIDATSAGQNVVLTWNAVADVDGYYVYFRTTSTGTWDKVGDVTATTYTHTATSAGYYVVMAYKGSDTSANNSNEVNTMPVDDTTTYTIYDNYSAADEHSAFIFGKTSGSGQTGLASNTNFVQDIYAWDLSKGDTDVWLLSGNWGTYGNGRQSYMFEPAQAGYCDVWTTSTSGPSGPWFSQSYMLYTSDARVFVYLYDGYYAKIYNLSISADPNTANGTIVSFSYEIQTIAGLTLFTSK